MKLKIFSIIAVFILIGGLISLNFDELGPSGAESSLPCGEPLTYRFDDVDARFDITEQHLRNIMDEVEDLWASALNRDLLEYDPDGKVAIRLIYSEEQKRTEDEQSFAKRIEAKQERIEIQREEYQRLAKSYKKRVKDFKKELSEYNQMAESYNELAQKWEGQDISDSQLSKLNKMEQQIKKLKSKIDRKQENLEFVRKRTNKSSEELNQLIDEQNELINTYNNRFGGSMQFDQGQFVKKGNEESIRIYQFSDHSQLKVVLAHEAGHALGLQHVENPESIMYHMMGEQNIFDLELTSEDIAAIKKRCGK